MALSPLRLALLLILICVFATGVTSQKVTINQVTTTSLVLNWQREGQWADVGTYKVDIQANGHPFCESTQYCFSMDGACSFSTGDKCAMFPPCADVVVSVSGGTYTAPSVNVQTAPAGVTDLKVTGSTLKEITWTNPNSSCLDDTVANVTYGGYYDYTEILTPNETSLSVPLCNKGSGFVRVSARGGDGESDPESAALIRWDGNDAVTITSCPTEGCTDMTVEWQYDPVCSEVTHFEVTATLGSDTIATTTTTDLANTTAIFEDLELDTVYETCVSALDKDDNLIAASCTACGTYPEVVDQLTLMNITDTTAELTWEAPLCQVEGNIEYIVSYSVIFGNATTATTATTTFRYTDLSPATNYTFCVLVQHPGVVPDHTSSCTSTSTLPAALEKIDVRVYETTSLFITWPGDIFRPNLKYLVSWGDDLEHSDYTEYKSYTIEGYNQTAGPNKVCVQAALKSTPGKSSDKTCQEQPFAAFGDPKPDQTAMIVSVSVSAGLAVLLSVVLLVAAKSGERHIKDTSM